MNNSLAVEEHLVSLVAAKPPEFEQYLTLRHQIDQARRRTGLAVVAVTSATMGDGKTTTSINLAGALAQNRASKVLLIDADLRSPSVASRLGLEKMNELPGLADSLADSSIPLAQIARRPPEFRFSLIAAGRETSMSPGELVQSTQFEELMKQAREQFDYVVVDTTPLIPVSDARVIQQFVDGVVMVVAANKTPKRLVGEALEFLIPSKVLGIVFNSDDRPLKEYYSYYSSRPRRSPAPALSAR
ncbi:MAG TPA: CpsD/CapB family tyrosine-protein kinase [Vicinamibacterales bacterium]